MTTIIVFMFLFMKGCFAIISKPSEILLQNNFVHRVVLDQDGAYIMLWTPLDDKIEIEVQVSTI